MKGTKTLAGMLALFLAVSLTACDRPASQETDTSAPAGLAVEAPVQENTEVTVTADEDGLLTLEEIPEEYLESSGQPGQVVRINYDSNTYDEENRPMDKYTYVYLPYGYDASDEDTRYDIFYLMHGWTGDAELYLGGENGDRPLKRIFDHLIANGDMKPMIIAAPQLGDWGETSVDQTIALTRYLLNAYNIDTDQVYANGYSGGGETMSLVLEKAPELFTAYLHCSSKWDGDYAPVVENRLPVYLAIGESDEYYSSEPTREAYEALRNLYLEQGLSEAEIDRLLVLDIKDSSYFTERGISSQHGGGAQFAFDEEIMGWLFEQTKG